jgi:DNA-directed RNA polymerase specialized sigma24 family protein
MRVVDKVDRDSQLVACSQGGDQDAFAELVRRHSDLVFRLALSILGWEFAGKAEDVAQEVFLKGSSRIGIVSGRSGIRLLDLPHHVPPGGELEGSGS